MKILIFLKLKALKMLFVMIMVSFAGFSQEPVAIIWDKAVGCQESDLELVFHFNVEDDGLCIKVCENSTVTYELLGGNPFHWSQVDFTASGGTITNSTNTQVTVNWGSAGWGSLFVSIQMLNGDMFEKQICIEKTPAPEVYFNIAPFLNDPSNYNPGIITVCKNEIIFFQNYSHPNGGSALISHHWTVNGPSGTDYLMDFEPSYVFTESGVYEVTLTVTNECNCSSSRRILFKVLDEGLIIECNSVVCENTIETYTIKPVYGDIEYYLDCEEYNWIVEGGTIISQYGASVDVKWDNVDGNGFGYLTFIPESCNANCMQPVTIKVPVIRDNIDIQGPEEICEGQQVRYAIPRWPTTEVEWSVQGPNAQLHLSDQKNEIIFSADAAGTYYLTANYTNTLLGCGGTAIKEIKVIPIVTIKGEPYLCVGDDSYYGLSNSGYADWTLNGPEGYVQTYSGTSFHANFPYPGGYTISVDGSFCIDEAFLVHVDNIPPVPDGIQGPDEICPGTPTIFKIPNSNSDVTAHWQVDNGQIINGNPGNEVTVVFDPNSNGPFKIRARNQIRNCASEWVEKTLTEIIVDFEITGDSTVCSSTYSTYSVDETRGDKYIWHINPDYLGSVIDQDHSDEVEILWNNVPVPTVATLTAEVEICGQTYFETFQVTVQMAPDVTITAPDTICRDQQVSFGLNVPGGLTSWSSILWEFGDGHTAVNTTNPTHSYKTLATGQLNYIATVKIVEPNGCPGISTASFSITVLPAPVAAITPGGVEVFCQGDPINPQYMLVIDTNYPTSTSIDWYHDGNLMSNPPYQGGAFTPTQLGSYYAIVHGTFCSTKTNTIYIREVDCGPPDLDCFISGQSPILNSQIVGCGLVNVTATIIGNPISYHWTAIGGTIISQTNTSATIQYHSPGTKMIHYDAIYNGVDINNDPCESTLRGSTNEIIPYIADIKYSVACSSTPGHYDLTLYDASTFVSGFPVQNLEFFLNGNTLGTGNNGQVTVPVLPGQHTISLEISSPGEFPCVASLPIDLTPLPTAVINAPLEGCPGKPIQFTATVNDPNLTYLWDFEDQAKNSLPDPIRVFNTGSYNVSLTVTNRYGCSITVEHQINIQPSNMDGEIMTTPATACIGQTILLEYYGNPGTTPPNIYHWTFNGNTTTTTSSTFTATQSGEYVVDGETLGGCYEKRIASIHIAFLDTPVAHITGPDEVCAGHDFQLKSRRNNPSHTYAWTRNGQPLPQFNGMHSIVTSENSPGVYTYGLTIVSESGCSDTDQFTVTVNPSPDVPQITMTLQDCYPYTVLLQAAANEPGTFNWSTGESGSSIIVHKGGPYRVIFTNQYGCSNSIEIDVPFDPAAYIWVHPTGCYDICEQHNSVFYLSGPIIPFEYWAWNIDGSVASDGHGHVDNQYYSGDGDYTLYLNNRLCDVESNPMSWNMHPNCQDCRFEEYHIEGIRPILDDYGNCYYHIYLHIVNPHPPLSYTLQNNSGNGIIVPGGGVLPNGPSLLQLELYPNPGLALNGGTVDLMLMAEIGHGEESFKCYLELSLTLPPCQVRSSRPSKDASMDISVIPNPTSGYTTLYYQVTETNDSSARYSLSLYDLTGRLLSEETLKGGQREWQMNLATYADGIYLVVLRKNETVQGYKRIRLQR